MATPAVSSAPTIKIIYRREEEGTQLPVPEITAKGIVGDKLDFHTTRFAKVMIFAT